MTPNDTHREQLSALVDGALDADQSRFLLRRLQHDDALAECLSRWQVIGDVLRDQAQAPAPAGFAAAIAARIADEDSEKARQTAATRVDFFTMVRGED